VGIPNIVHRHDTYYGNTGFCMGFFCYHGTELILFRVFYQFKVYRGASGDRLHLGLVERDCHGYPLLYHGSYGVPFGPWQY